MIADPDDDRMPPADLMPADEEAKMELANEWREKRALAEGIGGRFEVRSRGEGPAAGPASLVGLKIARDNGWSAPEADK